MKNFREILDSDGIYVFDGAVGTRLYDKGIYINRIYDELNIAAPDLVREVHEEYVAAGADIIETNTFGATRHKLQSYGLESKLREINIAAVKLAREAAGESVFVAGAIGPLGLRLEPFGPTSFDEAREMYKEQVAALLEGGVDLFVLETFSELPLIEQAIAMGVAQRPDIVCVTGDFISHRSDFDPEHLLHLLSRLSKVAPAYAVVGNHDGGAWAPARHGYPARAENAAADLL